MNTIRSSRRRVLDLNWKLAILPLSTLFVSIGSFGFALAQDTRKGNGGNANTQEGSPIPRNLGTPFELRALSERDSSESRPHVVGLPTADRLENGWLIRSGCPVFAIETIEVAAKETGMIDRVMVMPSDEVRRDQTLAQLEIGTLGWERKIAALQAQVASSESQDESEIRFAEALVEEAKLAYESVERVRSRGSASDTEIRQRKLAVDQAELKVNSARQASEQRKLRAQVAMATVHATDDRLSRLTLTSPIDGVITDLYRKPKEWVQMGQPVCKIVRLDELRVDCYISIDQVDPIKLLQAPVIAVAKATNQEELVFSGKVDRYDPEVSSLGTVRIHSTIQNQRNGKDWRLLPGMTVMLKLQTSPNQLSKSRNGNAELQR